MLGHATAAGSVLQRVDESPGGSGRIATLQASFACEGWELRFPLRGELGRWNFRFSMREYPCSSAFSHRRERLLRNMSEV
jgi:hypothetical protein